MLSVLVTNAKGGAGKTTLAVTLATAFASEGHKTALADVDRQGSALGWLALRPGDRPPIAGLDWHKSAGKVQDGVERLVIDAPAGARLKHVDELQGRADLVVVPVQPSLFDERSTGDFLARLDRLKPIRKGRKAVLVVANRTKPRGRASQRLVDFLKREGFPPVASLSERAAYQELAIDGLGAFDPEGRRLVEIRRDWEPLLRAISERA
ncbi:MAG: ParA family protein [Geminicoccaceae bacterium]|nr:ParA family protein [Geminicoccaceae bacterium]